MTRWIGEQPCLPNNPFVAERWDKILRERSEIASVIGLDENFIRKVYVLIHDESIRKQQSVMNKNLIEI